MAETLKFLSIISFTVSGVCMAFAVFFWIFFKIPDVVGDLSGRNARKSIAKMRTANEKTGLKFYRESKTNAERGKLTEKILQEKPKRKNVNLEPIRPETGILATNKADKFESEETYILRSEETGLLMDGEAVTSPLNSRVYRQRMTSKKLKIIEEVMIVHTKEVIE